MEELVVLELFSGIGGMHFALKKSSLNGRVLSAIDINQLANLTYQHNFPATKCRNNNIQKLKVKEFQEVNTILMSPPCQPFTRNGLFKDTEDNRSDAFLAICTIIQESQLENLKFILMENVMGFEKSLMRDLFVGALICAGFHFQEFLLSPTQVGEANTRHRYYCIARKDKEFAFKCDEILKTIPNFSKITAIPQISSYLDKEINEDDYLLPDDVLEKRFSVLDIRMRDSTNSMCFTKSYTRFIEGTGSVFCNITQADFDEKIKSEWTMEFKKSLKLRFFTPSEVARLMSFPDEFKFPDSVSEKQKYKLLGNSINVFVVSELIKLLCER